MAGQRSYGEKAVGLDFNPSGNPQAHAIKRLFAELIDLCDAERLGKPSEAARLWSIAITQAQDAQMWAVKAATWREE